VIPRRRIAFAFADLFDAVGALRATPVQAQADVAAFEAAFARALGVRHALATASGRDALGLILDALGLAVGDELVIPAYTLGELLPLIQARGIVPIPADIDPASLNVTADSVARRLGLRTRAILVVHLLGAPCDICAIGALADAHGIPVIEDCAHAVGARVDGRPVGSFGRAALFSLEATKAVAAFGGGVVATGDDALAAHVRARLSERPRREGPAIRKALLKLAEEAVVRSPVYGMLARALFSGGRADGFDRFYRRANDRARGAAGAFTAFQARLALRRLAAVEARNRWLNALRDDMAARLPPRFAAQQRGRSGEPAFYNLVALFDGDIVALRAAAQRAGLDLGIGGEVMDDTAALLGVDDCPGAAQARARAVLIPLYAGLSERRRERIVGTLDRLAADLR
jgi:dTDP-4-amino-4,6-dideoxygalactose transaminase